MNRDQNAPVIAVLVMTSLLMGFVLIAQTFTREPNAYFLNRFSLSTDYDEVYKGSVKLAAGGSPYDVGRYVYPPLPAMLGLPLIYFPFDSARPLLPLAVLVSVLASMLLLRRVFAPRGWRDDAVFLAMVGGILSLSYPFHFLFDRANLDGFALLLTALGLMALRRSEWLAGVALALAVGVKLYPVLAVLPFVAKRRWKLPLSMGAALLVLFLLAPEQWIRFLQERVLSRGDQFRFDENGSIASTFRYLGWLYADLTQRSRFPLAQQVAKAGGQLYLALVGLVFARDALARGGASDARTDVADVALYFPFMVAVPRLAYHYELVWLLAMLPAMGWLWATAETRARRSILAVILAGIALAQFQAIAAATLFDSMYFNAVPGLGLLLVMLGVVALKWTSPRQATSDPGTAHP